MQLIVGQPQVVEAQAQAARRLRLTPDALALDERERLLAIDGDFRFGRSLTAGATGDCRPSGDASVCSIRGGDCAGTVVEAASAIGAAGAAVAEFPRSRPLFTRPRPKASLNIAPYQSTTASAACTHGCAALIEALIGAVAC